MSSTRPISQLELDYVPSSQPEPNKATLVQTRESLASGIPPADILAKFAKVDPATKSEVENMEEQLSPLFIPTSKRPIKTRFDDSDFVIETKVPSTNSQISATAMLRGFQFDIQPESHSQPEYVLSQGSKDTNTFDVDKKLSSIQQFLQSEPIEESERSDVLSYQLSPTDYLVDDSSQKEVNQDD